MHARDQALVVFLDISFLEVFSEIFLVFQPISSLSEGNKILIRHQNSPGSPMGWEQNVKRILRGKESPEEKKTLRACPALSTQSFLPSLNFRSFGFSKACYWSS